MADVRELCFQILCRWTVLQDPPFLPERGEPTWGKLSPRDRAFGFDLLAGIIRWRGTLDAVIASQLRQPIDSLEIAVRAALWLGTYQILFQGTADYAAVDTAVELARGANPRVAGLVNAILRNITRLGPRRVAVEPGVAGAAFDPVSVTKRLTRRSLALDFETDLRFSADIFPHPTKAAVAHLADVRSHPRVFVDQLLKNYPDQAAAILLRNNQRPVVTLRADSAGLDVPASSGLVKHGETERFLVAAEGWNAEIDRLVETGVLSPQDPTSAKPVRKLVELVAAGTMGTPKCILDYCAGLGTKSIQLARAFPEAAVMACDVEALKLKQLEMRAKKLKIGTIATMPVEKIGPVKPIGNEGGRKSKIENQDIVLVDVPCSNTGVFAKRVQSRWRWPALDHAALAALQLNILREAASYLAPAGVLVYSTCSIDPAENQKRVAEFIAEAPAFRVVAEEFTLPTLGEVGGAKSNEHDGGYYAVLTR